MKQLSILMISLLFATSCMNTREIPDPRKSPVSGAEANQNLEAGKNLLIVSIDVGQGDSTLIVSPTGESMLIDTGPFEAGAGIISALNEQNIAAPNYIVITHYHADHTGGLAALGGIIPTGGVYDRGDEASPKDDPAFQIYAAAAAANRHTAYSGERFDLGDVDVEIVAQDGAFANGNVVPLETDTDENSRSIALLVTFGNFKMLIAGDITGEGSDASAHQYDLETPLGELVGNIDVLKVSHHGSAASTGKNFLQITKPKAAIISVGDGNDYSHPNSAVVERLIASGIKVYQTERGATSNENVSIANGNIYIDASSSGEFSVGP